MTANSRKRNRVQSPNPRHWEHHPDVFGSVQDISSSLICREGDQFLLTDSEGNVPEGNRMGLGLYSNDTRHLSTYDLEVNGTKPLVLLSTADSGFGQEQVLVNHREYQDGTTVGRSTVEIHRNRVLNGFLEERLQITNYNPVPVIVEPLYRFDADFADIFEVRGHVRSAPGTMSVPEVTPDSICYRYLGLDGAWRRTLIRFSEEPALLDEHEASFIFSIGPRETRELTLEIYVDEHGEESRPDSRADLRWDYRNWADSFASIDTSNEAFNDVIQRSLADLRMLLSHDQNGQSYFAAGTPWFATLFGRDSVITALQTLPFRPDLARNCLALLARYQGQYHDPVRVEEPGKILHEMRQDELSRIGEMPYERYYGSVDSTPLFLILAAEYYHWTDDVDTLSAMLPSINAALRWMWDSGDVDNDGFLEYSTDAADGLRNQGWKDSSEAILHADGNLCDGPIALAEVQGYAYLAYQRLVPLMVRLGETERAQELEQRATQLRRAFNRAFWDQDNRRVAMALDGANHPSRVMSSNAGQTLWSGLLSRRRARAVRDALFAEDMFSGWGIRTLSSEAPTYYPLGYHVGTIWPHDNGIIATGLKRYGFEHEVNELVSALFEAACNFDSKRLPEAFGGQTRSNFQPPVPYPVACRPQAWTAGTMLHLIQAMLGLYADAPNRKLYVVRPTLPYWLGRFDLSRLKVGDGLVNLHFEINQRGKTRVRSQAWGGVTVEVVRDWRRFFGWPARRVRNLAQSRR